MKIEQFFEERRGLTINEAFSAGMRFTAVDLCRFAVKFSESNEDGKIRVLFDELLDKMDLFSLYTKGDEVDEILIEMDSLIGKSKSIDLDKPFEHEIIVTNTLTGEINSVAMIRAKGDVFNILNDLNKGLISSPLVYSLR